MAIEQFWLGDMLVVENPPAKLTKALAVIAAYLHETWGATPMIAHVDKSKESCILASETVRRFLYRIGFKSAQIVPVCCAMRAERDGVELWSLGVGNPVHSDWPDPAPRDTPAWDGHMVVVVDGWLIDTTLYPSRRPAWEGSPQMIAVPLLSPGTVADKVWDHDVLTGFTGTDQVTGNEYTCVWLDQHERTDYRDAPDFIRKHERERVVDVLVAHFGKWED
jgi:hypothetical protein